MTLICITHSMPGRSCTFRGHHLDTCDGTRNGKECHGCLPRPAETGILCRSCWERFEAALSTAVDLITHLRSVEKGPVSIDGVRTSTVVAPTFPGSWQAADRLWVALCKVAIVHAIDTRGEEPLWPSWTSEGLGFSMTATIDQVADAVKGLVEWVSASPESVVARTAGAEAAVEFFREVQRALAMFPISERDQKLRPIRCRECQQFTLWKHPPLHYLDDIVVQCANPACQALYDPDMARFDMLVLAQELSQQRPDVSAAIAEQVTKLLAQPSAELLSLAGLSAACEAGDHWNSLGWGGCRSVSCHCECHEHADVTVGHGALTTVTVGAPLSLPPSTAVQDPGTCPRCWLIHEGACA
ncbi:hypothetical protein GCM10022239_03650 [Leifsonia bigeumensis]|uniref:Uncharacterized protein n=1 Tax=Leifsonella bigeumensis TaxID=433643 RepID=A0ABP7F5Z5_9MICO